MVVRSADTSERQSVRRIHCRHDLARKLGTCGHLVELKRTLSAGVDVTECLTSEELPDSAEGLKSKVVPIEKLSMGLEKLMLDNREVTRLQHGQRLNLTSHSDRWLDWRNKASNSLQCGVLLMNSTSAFGIGEISFGHSGRMQLRMKRGL